MNDNVVNLNPAAGLPEASAIDAAGDWLAKMDRGLSSEEEVSFKVWLSESPENRETLFKMARMWDNMDALERLRSLFPEPPVGQHETTQKNYKPLAIAASMAFVGILVAFLYTATTGQNNNASQLVVLSEQLIETGTGDSRKVTLSDSSELLVNTNSSLRVTYTESQRIIELLNGEVHVKVAHNPARPLSVYAAGQVIQAVGTAFNVELVDNQVELIVTEGKVRVAKQDESRVNPLQPVSIALPDSQPLLSEGQKSILSVPDIQIEQIANLDMAASLSWQTGELVFRGESLLQVLNEVSRYNAVAFEVQDESLNETQVAGLFKTNDLQGFLLALEQNFAIESERVSGDKILLKKRG